MNQLTIGESVAQLVDAIEAVTAAGDWFASNRSISASGLGATGPYQVLALLLALVAPAQPLAQFFGIVAFQRQPDRKAQQRRARSPQLGAFQAPALHVVFPRRKPLQTFRFDRRRRPPLVN